MSDLPLPAKPQRGRPAFIEREDFRAWLSTTKLNQLARVGGMQPGSYISRCEKEGRPIASRRFDGGRRWRMLDVVARARADAMSVAPPQVVGMQADVNALQAELRTLTAQIATERHRLALDEISTRLTGAALLTAAEILAGRCALPTVSGVYFLICDERVVYVGQSTKVFGRVLEHMGAKEFDSFAYIRCEPAKLNALESLYIHLLRPQLNGSLGEAGMVAPIKLQLLLSGKTTEKRKHLEIEP